VAGFSLSSSAHLLQMRRKRETKEQGDERKREMREEKTNSIPPSS
jgi:hypothetical protein